MTRPKVYPLENKKADDESVASEARFERASGVMRPNSPIEAMMMDVEWDEENALGSKAIELFDQLEERERWVLWNLVYERRSIREVAKMMSLSAGSVHRIKEVALRKLREGLEHEDV